MPHPDFFASSPEAVGVDAERLDDVLQRVRQEVDEGLLPSAQIAVAREGRLALFETIGEASLTNSLDGMPCILTVHLPLTPVQFLHACILLYSLASFPGLPRFLFFGLRSV